MQSEVVASSCEKVERIELLLIWRRTSASRSLGGYAFSLLLEQLSSTLLSQVGQRLLWPLLPRLGLQREQDCGRVRGGERGKRSRISSTCGCATHSRALPLNTRCSSFSPSISSSSGRWIASTSPPSITRS